MRIGILGGSFDPVHYGHLLLAETCRESLALDQVWFIPAALPPHKQGQDRAAASHRLEMLQLAAFGNPRFLVNESELQRGGVSYTIDTLRILQAENPDHSWYLLMGADSLVDLPSWREPDAICRLATLVVVNRAGVTPPDVELLRDIVSAEGRRQIQDAMVVMPALQLSSREIRNRVAQGRSIRYRTPRAVEAYIDAHRLYQGQ